MQDPTTDYAGDWTDTARVRAIDDRLRAAGVADDLDAAIAAQRELLEAIRTDTSEVTAEQLLDADRAIEEAREQALRAERIQADVARVKAERDRLRDVQDWQHRVDEIVTDEPLGEIEALIGTAREALEAVFVAAEANDEQAKALIREGQANDQVPTPQLGSSEPPRALRREGGKVATSPPWSAVFAAVQDFMEPRTGVNSRVPQSVPARGVSQAAHQYRQVRSTAGNTDGKGNDDE